MWENPALAGATDKFDANDYCEQLDLGGYTDWHVPDIGELRSIIRDCLETEPGSQTCEVQPNGCLKAECDDQAKCDGCTINEGPADGCYWPAEMQGTCGWYWSSTAVTDLDDHAWGVNFSGAVVNDGEIGDTRVRCVRSAE